jgi:hypothetical protein
MNPFEEKPIDQKRVILRCNAYRYITDKLCTLTAANDVPDEVTISLEELRQIKEGLTDPSKILVDSLKQILGDNANSIEIDNYLVKPFEDHPSADYKI